MEIPFYEPFYLSDFESLNTEIRRLGLEIPTSRDVAVLGLPIAVGRHLFPNRLCVQPLSGHDAGPDGAPSAQTLRRYTRLAAGGAGLIWIESTQAGGTPERSGPCLHQQTAPGFAAMVGEIRKAARTPGMRLLLQLAIPGDVRMLSDEDLSECQTRILHAAALAESAGFDGVDIQCCRGAIAGALLRKGIRTGRFGGPLANRARFVRDCVAKLRERSPSLFLAVRLSAYEAVQGGFGAASDDYRKPDLTEPIILASMLREAGLDLLNVTCASPNLRSSAAERPVQPKGDADPPDEHPLTVLTRQLSLAKAFREAIPGLPVVGSGLSWLRQFVPEVAAGAIHSGAIDFAGLGRSVLAYPDAPAEMLATGHLAPHSTCMVCFACSQLAAEARPVGCPIRDPAFSGREYRQMRRFSSAELEAGARRCHLCEHAPCIRACRTQVDIPGFIQAFREGDERAAYEIIRRHDLLPELTSHLSPSWLSREGACIETALTGEPVPILDLQYAIAWRARQSGLTGVRLPDRPSGRRIAVVGGGPAGIAAAARLLEQGHAVELFEASDRLGGVPARLIPASRLPDPGPEIDALLAPARVLGRLRIHFERALADGADLSELRAGFDAVLIATGLWQERSFGKHPGAIDALAFLESAKTGALTAVPRRVAILSGGDCAMDAAKVAQDLGAGEVFVVFGGPRSAMHWHMPESWFASDGVHALMLCQPLGYETGPPGHVTGLRVRHTGLAVDAVLPVDLVVEAMGLEPARDWTDALGNGVHAAGAIVNGGASVAQCVADGLAAADQIHRGFQAPR